MRISIYTLGCKVNQNDSAALLEAFLQQGYVQAAPGEEADVYIVNSCTVTAGGEQKSRRWLRRAKRQNPGAVTVLTGCYPQAFPEKAAALPEADIVTGTAARGEIPGYVQKVLREGGRIVQVQPHARSESYEDLPIRRFAGHTRAFVKVEDGCDRRCAYCVIPRARGHVRSRSIQSVCRELEALAAAGYREAVLTGVNLSSYGKDTGSSLTELLEQCAQVDGILRLRLGSLEPDLLSPEDILRMARIPKLCPQFHLSLQSGCDATLRRMRRVYTTAQYRAVVDRLRSAFGADGCSITTDIIVGFPGESRADFAESCRFVQEIGFLKVHVFPFSRREGTPAWDLPDQLPEAEKAARSRELGDIAGQVRRNQAAAMQGRRAEVLLETPLSATLFTGYTPLYLPVVVSAPGHSSGQIVPVILGDFQQDRCRAVLSGPETGPEK